MATHRAHGYKEMWPESGFQVTGSESARVTAVFNFFLILKDVNNIVLFYKY